MKAYIKGFSILIFGIILGAGTVYGVTLKNNVTPKSQKNMTAQNSTKSPDPFESFDSFENSMQKDFDQFSNQINQQMKTMRSQIQSRFSDFDNIQKTTVNVEDKKDGILYKISLNNPQDSISLKVANGMLKFEEKQKKDTKSEKESFSSTQIFSLPNNIDEKNFSQKIVGNELQIFFPKKES